MDNWVSQLIDAALAEDIGSGDLTAAYFIPQESRARACVVARANGCLAGTEIAAEVFHRVDPETRVQIILRDGSQVTRGAHVMLVEGFTRSILTAERTALNFLQHLSGIATLTRQYVTEVQGSKTRILDTRKTTPGWRTLEKAAVVAGGGTNHRMGLYDRVMIKDNHLIAESDANHLQVAIRRLKTDHPGIEVELEADQLDQVKTFLQLESIDYILLDNMSFSDMCEAVRMRGKANSPRLEASGGITLDRVSEIASSGVDYISVGALTHSATALDLGLDFVDPTSPSQDSPT